MTTRRALGCRVCSNRNKPGTIDLTGKGAATVTASGSATVIGGAGTLNFTGSTDGKDSVHAGTGAATLTGGKGATDNFTGSTGTVHFVHGVGGKDTFTAGNGSETMVGAGTDKTGSDVFMFESTLKSGSYTIQSFTSGKDTIDLAGYTKAQLNAALASATFNKSTGIETITLADHSKITITGLTKALTSKDII